MSDTGCDSEHAYERYNRVGCNRGGAYTVHYRHRRSIYHIHVTQLDAESASTLMVDGVERHDHVVPLLDDAQEHWVELAVSRRGIPAATLELVQ